MSQPTTTESETPTGQPNQGQRQGQGQRRRGRRRSEIGTVTSDKMNKTRRVEVQRLVPHPKYGKFIKRRTVCYVHDEHNETRVGDLVEILESRPLSKQKSWRLLRILRKAPAHEEADEQARLAAQSGSGGPTEATGSEPEAKPESESESEGL